MKILLKLTSVLVLTMLLTGCGASMDAVWKKENYTSRTFKKVAVIAISKNLEYRNEMESAIISNLKANNPNLQLVSGLTLFPPNIEASKWEADKIEALLEQNGIDAVITTSLIDKYTTQDLDYPGGAYYYPSYHRVGRYMFSTYNSIYTSPTYDISENYVFQSSMFDLNEGSTKEDELVWQGQSNVVSPSSITSAAGSYAKNLVKGLIDNALF